MTDPHPPGTPDGPESDPHEHGDAEAAATGAGAPDVSRGEESASDGAPPAAPEASPQDAVPPSPQWTAGGALVLVLLAIVGIVLLATRGSDEQRVAEGYLEAIADGDLAAIQESEDPSVRVDPATIVDPAEASAPIEDVSVGSAEGSGDAVEVEITFSVGDRPLRLLLPLSRIDDSWKVADPLVERPSIIADHTTEFVVGQTTVAESPFESTGGVLIYPGRYEISLPESEYYTRDPVEVAWSDPDDVSTVQLPVEVVPSPTDALIGEVQSQYDAFLDECIAAGSNLPDGCPMSTLTISFLRSVSWSLDTARQLQLQIDPEDLPLAMIPEDRSGDPGVWFEFSSAQMGAATYRGSNFLGDEDEGTVDLDPRGAVRIHEGEVEILPWSIL